MRAERYEGKEAVGGRELPRFPLTVLWREAGELQSWQWQREDGRIEKQTKAPPMTGTVLLVGATPSDVIPLLFAEEKGERGAREAAVYSLTVTPGELRKQYLPKSVPHTEAQGGEAPERGVLHAFCFLLAAKGHRQEALFGAGSARSLPLTAELVADRAFLRWQGFVSEPARLWAERVLPTVLAAAEGMSPAVLRYDRERNKYGIWR